MPGSPWICPRCGTPTNTDNCPQCLHERPFASAGTNAPGSYFAIAQGPSGYYALPRPLAIGCLIILFGPLIGILVVNFVRR